MGLNCDRRPSRSNELAGFNHDTAVTTFNDRFKLKTDTEQNM